MGLDQKFRSLHCGLQAGLHLVKIGDRDAILFHDLPYEFEGIVARWLLALPPEQLAAYTIDDQALTADGWSAFVVWMTQTLHHELERVSSSGTIG